MKIENTWTGNWEGAFCGMRFPMNSNDKTDSDFGIGDCYEWLESCKNEIAYSYCPDGREDKDWEKINDWLGENGELRFSKYAGEYVYIGNNDLNLAQKLIQAGSPHDKFLRQIFVSADITAPLYIWKELDQYKVATVTDSTSTMHKLASTPITRDCFEMDGYDGSLKLYDREPYNIDDYVNDMWDSIVDYCETLRKRYLETKDERYWKELIRVLPESWLQKRHWSGNYSVIRSIVKQRKGHRLSEWEQFIGWAKKLPYANELLFI